MIDRVLKFAGSFEPRQKKLMLIISAFPAMLLYLGLVLWIADQLPAHWAIRIPYYLLVGTIWAFPLKPVFGWVNSPATHKRP